jgi:hypothetical protein
VRAIAPAVGNIAAGGWGLGATLTAARSKAVGRWEQWAGAEAAAVSVGSSSGRRRAREGVSSTAPERSPALLPASTADDARDRDLL